MVIVALLLLFVICQYCEGVCTSIFCLDYLVRRNLSLEHCCLRFFRFSSGLSVLDFMKRTTIAKMTPEALKQIGPAAECLAIAESLEAHGLSVRARLDRLNREGGE